MPNLGNHNTSIPATITLCSLSLALTRLKMSITQACCCLLLCTGSSMRTGTCWAPLYFQHHLPQDQPGTLLMVEGRNERITLSPSTERPPQRLVTS